jgi:hypothetical protein
MNGLLHRSHAYQRTEDRGLRQGSLDRDTQMLIQGLNSAIVALMRSNRRTLGAGAASGLRSHEGAPAKYLDLPLFSSDRRSQRHLGLYKISELLILKSNEMALSCSFCLFNCLMFSTYSV